MADQSSSGKARSNIYTVLIFMAFLVLACGIGYVFYRNGQLFGSGNPFEVTAR